MDYLLFLGATNALITLSVILLCDVYKDLFKYHVSKKDLNGRKFKITQITYVTGTHYTLSEYKNDKWEDIRIVDTEEAAKSYVKTLVKPDIKYIG